MHEINLLTAAAIFLAAGYHKKKGNLAWVTDDKMMSMECPHIMTMAIVSQDNISSSGD